MDIWGGGGTFILLRDSEILQVPKPLPQSKISSDSSNCFCTPFFSIPQKNSTGRGAEAPPMCWPPFLLGLGRKNASERNLSADESPLTPASARGRRV